MHGRVGLQRRNKEGRGERHTFVLVLDNLADLHEVVLEAVHGEPRPDAQSGCKYVFVEGAGGWRRGMMGVKGYKGLEIQQIW
jgi:hypothetical protein